MRPCRARGGLDGPRLGSGSAVHASTQVRTFRSFTVVLSWASMTSPSQIPLGGQ
jgi:hypothetical protein